MARKATWVGFWVNAALGIAKICGGIFGRSSALVADGVHSLSDFLTDIVVIVMVGIARKRPDNSHQFGHGRFEALATLILAVVLAAVAVVLFVEGLFKVIDISRGELLPRPEPVALVIIVASIVSKEWLFRYTKNVGEKIKSEAVVANAWHHRSDAFSSVATLLGVAGAMFLGEHWRILDPIAAMVVSVFIAMVSVKMSLPALSELLGASLEKEQRDAIAKVLNESTDVDSWHALRTFKSGNDAYVEVHLKLDPKMTVLEAHNRATKVEHHIKSALPEMSVHVTTHIEPDMNCSKCQLHE